jgi:hypothetical protein
MLCLFCGFPEAGYHPGSKMEFVCSCCVQILLSADQADLSRAYLKAVEMGYSSKVKAIESFLIPEESNARETKISKRDLVRKRPMRAVRPSRY